MTEQRADCPSGDWLKNHYDNSCATSARGDLLTGIAIALGGLIAQSSGQSASQGGYESGSPVPPNFGADFKSPPPESTPNQS
jgi:hypothetical protein